MKNRETLTLSVEQRRLVIIGVGLLVLVKLFELPYQEMITLETLVSVILIAIFIALLYFQKGTERNILLFFGIALMVNATTVLGVYSILQPVILTKLFLIGLLLVGFFIFVQRSSAVGKKPSKALCGVLLAGIFIMMMGNLGSGYVMVYTPHLDESPAQEIINQIRNISPSNAPLVVYETGVPIWHMDFTYWDVANGIQPLSVYSAYYLKTMPQLSYTISNMTYYAPDYIVDTQSRENGQVNIPNVTFRAQNISVYVPDHVLPTVFAIRGDELIPLKLEKYTPGDVVASGLLQKDDIVVLKGNYYKGWKVNGADADSVVNMIGTRLTSDTVTVRFTFDPLDYKIGALLSGFGVLLVVVLLLWKKDVEQYVSRLSQDKQQTGRMNKKKKIK
jgi:hypothetical protein